MKALPLAGRRIVVTRPKDQAQALVGLIRQAGGEPLEVPALEIRDLADLAPFYSVFERLDSFDMAIFVSRNAVRKAFALIGARPWPARLRVATVGNGSREELELHGITGVIAPGGRADSEALLALQEFAAVAGKRIAIFRGEGGRTLLGDTLTARGALVEQAACYRRGGLADAACCWPRSGAGQVTRSRGPRAMAANLLRSRDDAPRRFAAPHFRSAPAARSKPSERGSAAGHRRERGKRDWRGLVHTSAAQATLISWTNLLLPRSVQPAVQPVHLTDFACCVAMVVLGAIVAGCGWTRGIGGPRRNSPRACATRNRNPRGAPLARRHRSAA